jgi:hypothetical protein
MAETAVERAQAVQSILSATKDEPLSVRETALAAIGEPSAKTRDTLWLLFVGGLVLALVGSVAGVLVAALDGKDTTTTDDALKIFTPLLTGLVGVFVKSPRE